MRRVARQLGRYHVLDRIAFGGMAEIFRALTFESEAKARIVAIKQVLPHYAEDREFIDMLVDEAKLVSMLHHSNIVEIYEVGYVEGVYFLAMEHVDGKDVRAVLERCRSRGTRIPFEVSAYLLAEALAGLDTAHRLLDAQGRSAGLVHRDFSPSNILISYRGDVKICDFGIAKANFSRIQTKTGVIKGKVKYMSPEQAFGRKLDHRSDVFSAGSCLYEMLTGEPPFLAKNEIDLIFMVRDARITPPRQRIPEIPEELERAVFKSMTRARGSRFQSAAEFRASLLSYLRHRGAGNWRAELARFVRNLYLEDMARERSALDSFDLDMGTAATDLGRNLIADALGANAAYTSFNPYPTTSRPAASPEPLVHDAATRILQLEGTEDLQTAIRAAPSDMPVHAQDTGATSRPEHEEEHTTLWARPAAPPQRPHEPARLPELAGSPPSAPLPPHRSVAGVSRPSRGGPSPRSPALFRAETTEETTLRDEKTVDSPWPSSGGEEASPRGPGLAAPPSSEQPTQIASATGRRHSDPDEQPTVIAAEPWPRSAEVSDYQPTVVASAHAERSGPAPARASESVSPDDEPTVAAGSVLEQPSDEATIEQATQIASGRHLRPDGSEDRHAVAGFADEPFDPGASIDDTAPHIVVGGDDEGR